ncbi:MAG TPA: RDD family protein [Acidimicrobiales bacterium]|nr:RDD family protein [Acidimicrobiales bacterium]
MEGSTSGQTVGKRALGIRILDFDAGGSVGYGRAVIRSVGRFVSGIVFALG